jgi:hypothetical protein
MNLTIRNETICKSVASVMKFHRAHNHASIPKTFDDEMPVHSSEPPIHKAQTFLKTVTRFLFQSR